MTNIFIHGTKNLGFRVSELGAHTGDLVAKEGAYFRVHSVRVQNGLRLARVQLALCAPNDPEYRAKFTL